MFKIDPLTTCLLLLKIGLAGCGLRFGSLIYSDSKKLNKTGTAYVGKLREIKKYLGNNGMQISQKVHLSLETIFEHVAVFGKTGSCKSSALFIPNLLSMFLPKRSSIIIPDMKGEIYKLTSWYQKYICKREIVVFAPLNPEHSIGINPLSLCKDITEISKMAQTLTANSNKGSSKNSGGAEWDSMARPLICSALAYSKFKGGKEDNISNALQLIIDHTNGELEVLFKDTTYEIMEQWKTFKTCLNATGGISSSIRITIASALQIFLDYKVAATTSKNEFNPEDLRKRPIAFYIIYPDTRADYLAPLMATLFSQIIDTISDYFEIDNDCLPVFCFFDELANMGFIPGLNKTITTARSKKVALILCIHDVCQLYEIYGVNLTKTMLNNLSTKIVLPGLSDPETLEYISKLCGDCEITIKNESKTGDKTTVSLSKQTKRLFTPGEVCCLDDNTCIVKINNKQPITDNINVYWKNDIYNNRVVKQYL